MQVKIIKILWLLLLSVDSFAQKFAEEGAEIQPTILPIILKTPVAPPTEAQAKDRLLWYKGKKIDDSTIITPQASLVRWSKPRDMVIVQAKQDPFKKMISELANTEKRKEEFYEKFANRRSGVMIYAAINNTLKELDRIFKLYSKILKNTIELPSAISASTAYKSVWSHGGIASMYHFDLKDFMLSDDVKKAYHDVITLMKNYPPIDFPAPPETDFGSCYQFDGIAQNQSYIDNFKWENEFAKYEADIIMRSLSIKKTIQLNKYLQIDPETPAIEAGLTKAMEFATARLNNKTDLLIRKYGKDFKRLPAVVRMVISIERQKQLLGTDESVSVSKLTQLASSFDGFDEFIEQQMDSRNYDMVLNMAFIIGVERQRQLLGRAENDNKVPDYLEKINAFNRFRLEMELDYNSEEGGDCGMSTDKVSAKNAADFYVLLAPVNGKFGIYQHEQQLANEKYHQFGSGAIVPLKTGSGVRVHNYEIEDDKCITETFSYSDLPVRPTIPGVRMTFCENDVPDTLLVDVSHMKAVKEKDKNSLLYNYLSSLMNYTDEDVNEQYDKLDDEQHDINKLMEEKTIKQSETETKMSLEETKKWHELVSKREALGLAKMPYDSERKKWFFTFDAKNGKETIIDGETVLYYVDEVYKDQYGLEKKATFKVKIKVIHDPLPYKKASQKKTSEKK